ncbi:MAG: dTDP-4-dehydrorhamnose reductase [Atopobiaceae bacterium]|nr:dTDP-4-dehydrorhamnose reductase [Atopobiaceae bacterium]
MRILITGAKGQLGHELRRLLETGEAEIGPIPEALRGSEAVYIDVDELDITDAAAVDAFFTKHDFDAVINCAAMTNVDGCEKAEEAAYRVNALGPENLARASAAQGAKFVQVSTDYVFPGNEPGERVESDPTGPISAYGRTKLAGEELSLAANPRTFVVRTAWLYGYVGKNFVKTMLRLARELGGMTVVDDQLGNPTSANDLAHEILRLILTEEYSIYHCTNNGTVSWAGFARAIVEGAGYDPAIVTSCTSDEYAAAHPEAARRPLFSALRNAHLEQTIGDEMRPWQEALASYLEKLPELGAERG